MAERSVLGRDVRGSSPLSPAQLNLAPVVLPGVDVWFSARRSQVQILSGARQIEISLGVQRGEP